MKKDVVVKLVGHQEVLEPNSEEIEVLTTGEYYYKNGRHVLIFDEILEEDMGSTHNIIKIDEKNNKVTVDKKGAITSRMEFHPGEKSVTYYNTPLGGFTMQTTTDNINFGIHDEKLTLDIRYILELNYQHVSENKIHIESWEASCS